MNSQRFLILLTAALLIIGGGLFLSARRSATNGEPQGGALYPALAAELGSVNSLSVRKASATPNVTLQRKGENWTVAQRADYPADVTKLRKLLLSLTDAKIIEKKTADPANFPLIGVEDPASPSTAGTQIDFTAQDGAHSLIIGKSSGEGNFVRRGGENQSFLIAPSLFVETEPKSWIDSKLIDIPVATIQRIEIKPAGGASYSVHRLPAPAAAPKSDKDAGAAHAGAASAASAPAATPAAAPAPPPPDPGFALDGVPAGRKAADAQTLTPSSSAFSGLTADDVAPVSDVDFGKPSTATLTSSDGSVVTITGVVLGDKHWIQFAGIKDAAFAAKSAGRAYEVAGYRYDGIFRPLEQLLVPKETPAAAPVKGAKAMPAARPPKPPASKPTTGP
jgi:hypothetical protein